ncbi:MAG TPA: rod shape-determining protein MreC [Actinomycetota bacterium]|nr:rod shape-determining protein MreC [Actinomycetota bacterium]
MATRSRLRSTRLLVIALVSVSLVIITMDYRQGQSGPLETLGRAAQTAMAPLQRGADTVSRPVGDFLSGLAHLPTLQRQNQDLRSQLIEAQSQLIHDAELQVRVAQLQDLLGLQQTLDPGAVPAVVIGNGVSNFDWTITIDQGSNAGIQVGQPVITGSATSPRLVGLVVSVTPVSSDVQLLIDQRFAVAGRLSGSGETGLVTGQGEQDPRMDLISPDAKVDLSGDQPIEVFTVSYEINGQHGRYPPDILIGQVASVVQNTNTLETSVTVRPAVDFSALQYVLVLQTKSGGAG